MPSATYRCKDAAFALLRLLWPWRRHPIARADDTGFLNSIALQLVVVSMLFVPRKPGEPLTVNPIKVIISGTLTGHYDAVRLHLCVGLPSGCARPCPLQANLPAAYARTLLPVHYTAYRAQSVP